MARTRYRFVDGELIEIPSDYVSPARSSGPFLWRDYEGYQSPVSGEWIEGRAARREDMKRHGCIDGRELGERHVRRDDD